MGIRFDAGATGDLRLCRRVLPTAMLLVAPWTAGLAACLAAGRLMVRLIFRTRSFRGRRQSSGAAACGSSGLRRPTPGILYITGTVAGIPSVVVSAPVRDARPTLWATAQHTGTVVTVALLVLVAGLPLAFIPVVLFPVLRRVDGVMAVGIGNTGWLTRPISRLYPPTQRRDRPGPYVWSSGLRKCRGGSGRASATDTEDNQQRTSAASQRATVPTGGPQ